MEKNADSPTPQNNATDTAKVINLIGYPYYTVKDDIYNLAEKIQDMDPEKIGIHKSSNEETTGSDLDVPGAETDDDQEINGDEDEVNNYYSLGGDGHNDLDGDHWE